MDENKLQQIINQSLKEAHLMGLQSGKQETSGLVDQIIHKMEDKLDTAIHRGIETHVNGKIKAIDTKIDAYIKSDLEWKEDYTPYIKGLASVSDGGRILGKFVIFFGAVGAAVLAIRGWIK